MLAHVVSRDELFKFLSEFFCELSGTWPFVVASSSPPFLPFICTMIMIIHTIIDCVNCVIVWTITGRFEIVTSLWKVANFQDVTTFWKVATFGELITFGRLRLSAFIRCQFFINITFGDSLLLKGSILSGSISGHNFLTLLSGGHFFWGVSNYLFRLWVVRR